MGQALEHIGVTDGDKAVAVVEFLELGLGMDENGMLRTDQPVIELDTTVNKLVTQARSALIFSNDYAPNAALRVAFNAQWHDAHIGNQSTAITPHQVPTIAVVAVKIEVHAVLFHDKNLGPEPQNGVKLFLGQLIVCLVIPLNHCTLGDVYG